MASTKRILCLTLMAIVICCGFLMAGRGMAGIGSEVEQLYYQIIQPIKATNKTYHKFNQVSNYKMNLGEIYSRALKQIGLFRAGDAVRNAYAREASEMRRINNNHVEKARNPLRNIGRLMIGGSLERYDTKEAYKAFKRNEQLQQAMEDRKKIKEKMLEEVRARNLENLFYQALVKIASERGIALKAGDIKNDGTIIIQGKTVAVNDLDNKITREKKTAAATGSSTGIEERVRNLPPDKIGDRISDLDRQWKNTTDRETRKNIEYEMSLLRGRLEKMRETKEDCPSGSLKKKPGLCGCNVPDTDSDRDGVPDCKDKCPGTRTGERVNAEGCSMNQIDSDGDGVPDVKDKCPNTPRGERVDARGCSQSQLSGQTTAKAEGTKDPFIGSWRMTVKAVRHSDPEAMKEIGPVSEVIRLVIGKSASGYTFSGLPGDMKVTTVSVSGTTMTIAGQSGINYGTGYDKFTMRLTMGAGNSRMSGVLRYDHTSMMSADGKISWNENSVDAVRQ